VTTIDHDELLRRCAAIGPRLAERAAEGESIRRLPDATITDVREADLFRIIVPTALGGHGLGLDSLAQGTRVLAQGCPASAWTLSFLMLHAWLLTRFPAEGRALIFAEGPCPFAPAPIAPTGTATPVEGGFRVSGRWEWATGIAHADWVMVHAVQTDPVFATHFVVLRPDDVTVEDVWFTSGMRATGSNTVRVEDRFVPDALVLAAPSLLFGGDQLDGDGMAGLVVPPVLALVAAAPALGAAEAAVALYRERLAQRVLAYSLGDKASEQPAAQVRLATATSDLASARIRWDAAIATLVGAARAGEIDEQLRVDTRLAAAATVRASRSVISTVCEGAGASVYLSTSPLQRLQRDVEVLKGHVVFDWDRTAEIAGRFALGFPLRPTDMV
jgi:3-hydroxy-9,10-secoandrosta-1,3,5(10)-triene-9,17-dione monooxygenase